MIQIRKANARGHVNLGWLDSYHSFSFGDYHDPAHMHFGPLRVINEDRVAPGQGFERHSHRDMEIISYVIEGAVSHQDSMGNKVTIRPGEVQRMSAGTGVSHSEFNPSSTEPTHFLQIWILPEAQGLKPGYGQKNFSDQFGCSDLTLVASHKGREGSITLNQDVDLYVGRAQAEGEKHFKTFPHRHLWVQVVKGNVTVNGQALAPSDGAGITEVSELHLGWDKDAEFLFFDMP